jgi:hypothetical protein
MRMRDWCEHETPTASSEISNQVLSLTPGCHVFF